MNKQLAEFIGTFALVFFGCGAAVIGGMGTGATAVDLLGIASAFGFAIVAMAYGIGPISGCHVNPAVSFGVFVAGRMSAAEMVQYWIAQVIGALAGAGVLYLILSGKASGWTGGLGQNGWGPGNFGEYNLVSAFVFEIVATFLFLVTILGVTHPFMPKGFAGLAIGSPLPRFTSSASTSPEPRSIPRARSAPRWSASLPTRALWARSGSSSSAR